jgi:hypothetical protein
MIATDAQPFGLPDRLQAALAGGPAAGFLKRWASE